MLTVNFITNKVFNSRTYILSRPDYEKVWLVDCGDIDRVVELIDGRTIEGVLLTHAHSDHVYGLEELLRQNSTVKIFTNAAGVEALKAPRLNLSHYHSEYPDISIDAPENVQTLSEGDDLEVMGLPVRIYETPGHARSCITYIIEGYAFTGDAYIPGVKVFTGFPGSNRKDAVETEERILQLTRDCIIFPGHTVID